jgi:hypothetical protein
VIHVRVSDDYVTHTLALFSSQTERYAAGINGNALVYQKAG